MANYIKGIGGDCVDCTVDNPCDTDGPTDAPIDPDADAASWDITSEIRLHDLNHTADPQIYIVLFTHSTLGTAKIVAVRSSGVGIVSGATLSVPSGSNLGYLVRSSHTGNTFSYIRAFTTSNITNFSVNPTTLAITQLSSTIGMTAGYRATAGCFARDNELGFVEVTELPGPGFGLQYHYWTVDITGGGTGITENTRITETAAGETAPTFNFNTELAKIERIDDDFMIAHRAYQDGGNFRGHARGLDNTGALATGAALDYHSIAGSDDVVYIDTDEENDDGHIVTFINSGVYTPFFFRYVTTGTTVSSKFYNRLNTSIAGLTGVDGSEQVAPITITGLNITIGSNVVVATGNIHLLRGLNATKSVHFYQVTSNGARAELLG